MIRCLKAGLFGLALAFAASPALADGWSSTPWPSTGGDGTLHCYLGYADEPRVVMVLTSNAYVGDFRLLIGDPAFERASHGGEVTFVFPSGWRVSTPFQLVAPGRFVVGVDEASFHLVLDELETPGTLSITAGGGSITVTVSDHLGGRIRNLRGPLPEGSPMQKPCLDQLADG